MLKVGLTGGYATGKSFVASELKRLGCCLISADKLGHQVLQPDGAAYLSTIETFGPEILAPDATIDRKKLGAIVFAAPASLEKLNAIVHPAVFQLEEKMFKDFAQESPNGITVLEAAILIETGRYRLLDCLILTTCSEETQITRGMARDHLTREKVLARLQNQMPFAEKQPLAKYVIDTEGPKPETASQVEQIFKELMQLRKPAVT